MTLKVPYNFVPLNEKVVTPYWLDHISHDIPFRDGRSGTLKLTLTAESPIFVKRGEAKSTTQKNTDSTGAQKDPYEFEQDAKGNYFIPGSSLRGMVRSVVETLSFGRMIGRVSERRYAVRDLSNEEMYLKHFKANLPDHKKIRGGWLRYEAKTGKYILRDADVPGRISHRHLEEVSGVPISTYFAEGGRFDQTKDTEKAAERKYKLFADLGKTAWLNQSHNFVHSDENAGRKIYELVRLENDKITVEPGQIVMTGQPGPRELKRGKWHGKHLEFIFWEFSHSMEIEVPSNVVEDFKFAYFDHNVKDQSVDYKWRKKQLEGGEGIPVFWQRGVSDGQPTVNHFGLSYLYKLPYKYTVEDSIKNHQTDKDGSTTANDRDLADAIFGMVGEGKGATAGEYLKGRVQFAHAKITNEGIELPEEKVILGEPRASFYPTYLNQNAKDNGQVGSYKTFMDEKGQIAGRKRYPVLEDNTPRKTRIEAGQEKLITKFLPLDKGTTFTCELSYHNLRAVELGALLSALTFHGTDRSRHQVGMAKPLGFGKVKVSVADMSEEEQQELMLRYEAYMDQELGGPDAWRTSPQVTELVALTAPVRQQDVEVLNSDFAYNSLDGFRKVKNNKEGLPLHSQVRKKDKPEIGLDSTQKASFQQELDKDRAAYKKKQVLTPSLTEGLIENEKKQVYRQFGNAVDTRLEALEQRLEELRAEEKQRADALEKQQLAEKRAVESEAAAERGLDLSGVEPSRKAIAELKRTVNQYLEKRNKKRTKKFTDEEWLLPTENDQQELIGKVSEIHAEGSASRDFTHTNQVKQTKKTIAAYLGQEGMRKLFDDLN